MPYKNPEDRKAFDRARKARQRAESPDLVQMRERQQKQFQRVDARVAAKVDARLRKDTGRPSYRGKALSVESVMGLEGASTVEAAVGLPGETDPNYRGRWQELGPETLIGAVRRFLPDEDVQPLAAIHELELRTFKLIPDDVENPVARALLLAIYRRTGPNPDRAAGPTPAQLAGGRPIDEEWARALRELVSDDLVYVANGGHLSIRGRELPDGAEPLARLRQRCLRRLDEFLAGGRTPIDESFELADALHTGEADDLGRADLLGA